MLLSFGIIFGISFFHVKVLKQYHDFKTTKYIHLMKKFFTIFILFAMTGLSSAYTQKLNIDSGLVAYYPFNGNANDESGNGNNGTVNGATLTSDRFGNANKAYSFNGTQNYIEVPDQTTLRFNSSFSISLWFSFNSFNFNPSDIAFISKALGSDYYDSYEVYYDWHYRFSAAYCNTGGCDEVDYFNTPSINNWYHIVSLFDKGSNTMKLYLNGILAVNTPLVNSSFTLDYDNNSLLIGVDSEYGANDQFFDGKLDDIRLYNRLLTETEIQQLYNENGTGIPSYNNFNIEIYPNPTTEKVYIKTDESLQIKVFNILGRANIHWEQS